MYKRQVYDFSTTPEERAAEQTKINQAIAAAEKAMKDAPAVRAIKEKQFKDALVKESIAAKPLIKAKAAAKAKGSTSGRVVGISANENIFLKQLLLDIANNTQYNKDEAYSKLIARYNIKN